jgi:hypothetical protein
VREADDVVTVAAAATTAAAAVAASAAAAAAVFIIAFDAAAAAAGAFPQLAPCSRALGPRRLVEGVKPGRQLPCAVGGGPNCL